MPAQPADGVTEYVALGGDGFVAPHSSHSCTINVTGDASGGSCEIKVSPDPRYVALLSYVSVKLQDVGADENIRQEIRVTSSGSSPESFLVSSVVPWLPIGALTGAYANALWTPPAVLLSSGADPLTTGPFYRLLCVNGGATERYSVTLRFYNFDKRARELVPLPQILSTLVRSSTLL